MRRDLQLVCAILGALALLVVSTPIASAPLALARLLILGAALGLLALYDFREHRIPNRIVLPATIVCAALSIAEARRPTTAFYIGVVLVTLLFVLAFAAPRLLGMGDAKLALLILCALPVLAALALMLAVELYALAAIARRIRRGRTALGTALPLAPLAAAACIVTVLL
jgi:leader peptidase (prepilin peptidase)/N-methyltransferase